MGSARQRRARRRGDIQLARRAIRRGVCPCREPRILEHRLPHLAGCRWGIFRWTVALCVNDGHTGAFTGRLSALEIRAEGELDPEITLHGPMCIDEDCDEGCEHDGCAIRMETQPYETTDGRKHTRRWLVVGEKRIRCTSWASGVGNWCWDETTMSLFSARMLAQHVLTLGFSIEEQCTSGPFAYLAEKSAAG